MSIQDDIHLINIHHQFRNQSDLAFTHQFYHSVYKKSEDIIYT